MFLLLLAFGCGGPSGPGPVPAAPKGLQKIEIEALTAELTSARSHTRIYNFWATWCGPCIRELPLLRDFASRHDDVEMVLVNVDFPTLHDSKVPQVVERLELDDLRHLALVDRDPAFALRQVPNWPSTVPVTLVVNPDGTTRKQFNVSVSEAMLLEAIASNP